MKEIFNVHIEGLAARLRHRFPGQVGRIEIGISHFMLKKKEIIRKNTAVFILQADTKLAPFFLHFLKKFQPLLNCGLSCV